MLLHGEGKEKEKLIIHHSAIEYGFGNQFRSLLGNVVFALVTGRRLRSNFSIFQFSFIAFQCRYGHSHSFRSC